MIDKRTSKSFDDLKQIELNSKNLSFSSNESKEILSESYLVRRTSKNFTNNGSLRDEANEK